VKTSGSEPSPRLTRAQLIAENLKLRREIDHRVRNSLQIVASLVDVTARSATEPSALAVLDILRARISALIAVYQRLDDVPHRASVNMGDTLRDLMNQVAESRPGGAAKNEAQIEAENIILPLDDAMPVALMVIEVLLATALQADADSAGPTATVALTREGADARLRIHLVNATGDTLMPLLTHHAQEMIQALARQLGGPLTVDNDEGVSRTIEVRFPVRDLNRTHE
jgi:two-component sensor histidine kinase